MNSGVPLNQILSIHGVVYAETASWRSQTRHRYLDIGGSHMVFTLFIQHRDGT